MKAIVQTRYGSPDVLTLTERPAPTAGPKDLLVEVRAAALTQGDRRLRAGDFPGVTWLPGRLVMGLLGPRQQTGGTTFAGKVLAVGRDVTRFTPGDDVFGTGPGGALAERLVCSEDSAVAHMPVGLDHTEAAALPYGAETAHHFLVTRGEVSAGQRVCIIGATGGVGRYAVQIAHHLGAHVTAVCSAAHADLARELGADQVVNYRTQDLRDHGPYDVVLDTVGASGFHLCREALTATGRYLSLMVSFRLILQSLSHRFRRGGQRAILDVALGTAESQRRVARLAAEGVFTPHVARCFSLADTRQAFQYLEEVQPAGEVIVCPAPSLQVRPRAVAHA